MLKSMTGFGKAESQLENKIILVEVRALNSNKGLDLSLKLPSRYRELEYTLRTKISETLQRGKIDVSISFKSTEENSTSLNKEKVLSYFKELKAIAEAAGTTTDGLLPAILKMPDVTSFEESEDLLEAELKSLEVAIGKAMQETDAFRTTEGKDLEKDLCDRIKAIENLSEEIKLLDKKRVTDIRERLKNNLETFIPKDKVDQNRFEQEVVFYIEKLDISEEFSRLASHCLHFIQTIKSTDDLIGRKLNFIAQEIGREINTIGSKANDAGIQKHVVNMKDELEKIKEQVNNVL
jgi:uncharacterized protein (TIGR00255 family)